MFLKVIILLFGVFCCSTAGPVIKNCSVPPVMLGGIRLFAAGIIIMVPALIQWKKANISRSGSMSVSKLKYCVVPAVMLALHFMSWNLSLVYTPVVNASLIVNMMPVAMPFFMWIACSEKINRGEVVGTVITILGLGVIAVSDFKTDPAYFRGDIYALASMICLTFYLGLARKGVKIPGIWIYLAPVYGLAGVICCVTALFIEPLTGFWTVDNTLSLLWLVFVPTLIGHTVLNHMLKVMRGQFVSLANLAQFIFAGCIAYYWLNEAPSFSFFIASPMIAVGAVIALLFTPSSERHVTGDK